MLDYRRIIAAIPAIELVFMPRHIHKSAALEPDSPRPLRTLQNFALKFFLSIFTARDKIRCFILQNPAILSLGIFKIELMFFLTVYKH
jgi:hypothetical protein